MILLLLALQPPALAQDGAVIVSLSGQAWVQVPGGAPTAVDRCATVPAGATICTAPDAFAAVRLAPSPDDAGADDVVLLGGTCLDVLATAIDRARVNVSRGGVTISPSRDGGLVEVATRDGVTAGREGGFRVTLEEVATRTEAVTGRVQLQGDGGVLDLPAGKGSRMRPGRAPDAPTDLLLPQALLHPPADASLRRPDFAWTAVPGSTGYHLQLAADPAFLDIVEAVDVGPPQWQPDFLFSPTEIAGLWWRVAAYDRLGFLGVPTAGWPLSLPAGVPR
ncbi:hypothetical protein L6R53_10240 [Myxococcota bacterium]|nr:hypothetical protein [Myxococcota bacterium]